MARFRRRGFARTFQPGYPSSRYPEHMGTPPGEDTRDVVLRRSPKLVAFVLISGLLGFFGTLIATGLYPADPSIGFAALFGYFALFGVTGSIGLGVLVWLIIDVRSRKRARTVQMRSDNESDTD